MTAIHTALASLSHRRMIDPITFAVRKNPFVIERIDCPANAFGTALSSAAPIEPVPVSTKGFNRISQGVK